MEALLNTGIFVKNGVLNIAALLKEEAAPGLVTLALLILLALCAAIFTYRVYRRVAALDWIRKQIAATGRGASFSRNFPELNTAIRDQASSPTRRQVATAWEKYRETFVDHEEGDERILRNAVRPSVFFNVDDLGFGPGFWRIVPGLFVTSGLFLTFLGLISALNSMAAPVPIGPASASPLNIDINTLLTIASAKFIMSLTGLLCSILFTIGVRLGIGRIEHAVHALCGEIEKRLTFISLEDLAVEQLDAIREQREAYRTLGYELVAELGRPLREELPQAISASISSAMSPLLQQVGQAGAEGMGSMVKDLSSRFSDDVGKALSHASEKLAQAGEGIEKLSTRMDSSSGRMGAEMDAAVTRLAQAVDELRHGMTASADSAGSALTQGADRLLSAMNETLQGIRDNTGEGARAMSAAAADMRQAAEGFKAELEEAARTGSEAARTRMEAASAEAGEAINTAGRAILDSFDHSRAEITRAAEAFSTRATQDLLGPLDVISERLNGMVSGITEGASNMRRLSDGVLAGAAASEQAAGSFRAASQDLIGAVSPIRDTTERLETSARSLADSTRNVSDTVSRSAEATARSAADALASAQQVLGGQAKTLEASLAGLSVMVERMRGQGDRLDDMDEKLGRAFETYTERVSSAVSGMFDHVRTLQTELQPALDTLRAVVEQAEQFAPQSRRN